MNTGFDATQFMIVGFSYVSLDINLLESIRPIVQHQVWIDDSSEDGLQEADWCAGGKNRQEAIVVPSVYSEFVNHVDDITKHIFGNNVYRDKTVMWMGGEELDWHEHISDKEVEDYHWLIYLGDDEWREDAGGLLLLQNAQDPDNVFTVYPTYGTAVLLNNTNANYLHKVTKYTPTSKRIVLQVSYYTA